MARNPRAGFSLYQPSFQAASAVSAAFTPSRNTKLWREHLAEPQNGAIRSTISGYSAPQWKVCRAPIDQPVTSGSRLMPNVSVTSRCCSRTLSQAVTCGKRGPL